ncbi:Predicted acetyltransferase [Peptoclostridium litorale DSM 5388]|uniref:Acetyltransferase n=1 Tax=Peptoclostridium litorale DSM 5388 TaxID=1121324 RepID=A0A069RGG0_PEPLI|nr:GNAT family N-acetyltransferase [Peptoclostridium litorale]KDR95260.1 acetyltransferase [Peptoclostridium litorale DSM 5388]SIN72590.1 Predicted acetyltransferase [Peptoclostridium litorale DSM 5388]
MAVEYARDEDKNDIIMAWKYCFGDSEKYVQYYFGNRYSPDTTLVLREDNIIKASLQKNKYNLSISGQSYDIPYIVGVLTLPQYRGYGYMGTLLQKALEKMHSEGSLASILMPVDNRIYRKFGFENIAYQREYSMQMGSLPKFKRSRCFESVDGTNQHHLKQLCKVYSNCIKDKNLYAIRDEAYFENLIKEIESEDGYIYMSNYETGGCDGYIAYVISDNIFIVREMMYENIDSLKSMLGFIHSHGTQVENIVINTFEDDYICDIIPNLRKGVDIKTKLFLMGRIVNAEGFIERMKPAFDFKSLKIGIYDELLEHNNSGFDIKCSSGLVEVERIGLEECDIQMDISAFSQLAFSGISVQKILFLGRIEVNNPLSIKTLERLFFKRANFFNEYV